VKGVRIGIRKYSNSEVNNIKKTHRIQEQQNVVFLVKVLELFLRHPILVLVYKQEL
jgi:hypothetical protein